jgi:3D (Asp-Asp-Asp) domain-containing protein/septal ring factor EnvC (AmiA/AmiB activator)
VRRGAGWIGRRSAVVAAALVVAGLLPTHGDADTAATPRARDAALQAQQVAVARRERRALLDLYALETRLARARESVESLRAHSARLAQDRELTRRRAGAVRRSLATARRRLAQTLRTLYKQGQRDPVAILLGASSIDQAAAGIDSLKRAARADRQLITALRRKEARVRLIEAQLRARDRELAMARRSAAAAAVQLDHVARARSRTLAALRARRDLTRREVASLDALARRAERRSVALTSRAAPATTTARAKARPPAAKTAPGPAGWGKRTLVVDAVAYHLSGRTASGLPVARGVVAVDPTVIPLGTRLFVPGYDPAVAADVGSAVKGSIIDLWMPTRAKALAWGRRTVTITIYG